MTPFNEMLEKITFRFSDKIKKKCAPLTEHFGVNHFSYCKITNSGLFSTLSSYPAWAEYYFSEKLHTIQPHFRHPEHYKSGISIPKMLYNEAYQEVIQMAQNKFNINPCVVLIQKKGDYVELFGFDTNCSNGLQQALLISEISLLQKFIQKFREDNLFLFDQLDKYQVNLLDLLGKDFYNNFSPLTANLPNRSACIEEMGLGLKTTFSLSERDVEILQHLLQGASANVIAEHLKLSKRTVEHYIERLKDKLICYSKMDLIRKARELEQLGYLNHWNH